MPRLDIVQQLNEIEARREEYPETLALMRLLNALLGPLAAPPARAGAAGGGGGGAGGVGLPDGGADVSSFTLFIQQVRVSVGVGVCGRGCGVWVSVCVCVWGGAWEWECVVVEASGRLGFKE